MEGVGSTFQQVLGSWENSERLENVNNSAHPQERRQRRLEKLQTNMSPFPGLQTVHENYCKPAIDDFRRTATKRTGRLSQRVQHN